MAIAGLHLQPPGPHQQVFKDDCVYCFDTPEAEGGLDVCLQCFLSSCPSPERNHTALHHTLTGHTAFLNIKRVAKTIERPQKLVKLAISAESDEDRFETTTSVKDLAASGDEIVDISTVPGLEAVVQGILNAQSYAKKEEIQAWEQEITACEHTQNLIQAGAGPVASHCLDCDLNSNLWLCLTCGNTGCGRAQFGGVVEGHGHGLQHFEKSRHPLSVKLGSITPDGTADVFCYICNDEVRDPALSTHLAYLGINIAEREKTEKSLTEMQLEQNLKWDFHMTGADGAELTPIFGPSLTGLKNLGNSCYMASVLQVLFSLAPFQDRFGRALSENELRAISNPAEDLEVQMHKVADGLLSGRYSVPARNSESETPYQQGLAPGMFKYLVGRGHEEFSTMRQQDAFEFWIHLLDKVSRSSAQKGLSDPTDMFKFVTEQRLECNGCHRVRYKDEDQENLSLPVPVVETSKSDEGVTYQPVELAECFGSFTHGEVVDYKCKYCGHTYSTRKLGFKTFPEALVLNVQRFQIINWVPTKLDIAVSVNEDVYNMDRYFAKGPQEGENVVNDEDEAQEKFVANADAMAVLQGMGFPEVRCEKALHATGNRDAEIAANWLFMHMEDPDIDQPVELKTEAESAVDPEAVQNLGDMGFTVAQATTALKRNNGSLEAAVEWLFANPGAAEEDAATLGPHENKVRGRASLPANYKLKAIICHKGGSVHAGHYVAYVRTSAGWVLFNDEKVVQGADVEEMKKYAYMYVFEGV